MPAAKDQLDGANAEGSFLCTRYEKGRAGQERRFAAPWHLMDIS
jgi:hypothetical protein